MKKELEAGVIYCGDSKDILKDIPDNSIDLMLRSLGGTTGGHLIIHSP